MANYVITHKNKIPLVSKDNACRGSFPDPWNTSNGPTPDFWYTSSTTGAFLNNTVVESWSDCGSLSEYTKDSVGSYTMTVFTVMVDTRNVENGGSSQVYYSSSSNHNSDQGLIKCFNWGPGSGLTRYEIVANYYGGSGNKGETHYVNYSSIATQSYVLLIANADTYVGSPPGGDITYARINGITPTATTDPGSAYVTGCSQYKKSGAQVDKDTNNYVREYIVYFSSVTGTDRTTVEDYLKNKWGITY